jgi:hypothetical protein
MVTKPEIELRGLDFVTVGEAPLGRGLGLLDGRLRNGVVSNCTDAYSRHSAAATIPMTNCVMRVLGMIASIHDATCASPMLVIEVTPQERNC